VVVTPESTHGPSGALKNPIDSLYPAWNTTAAGRVRYGGADGARVVVQVRLVIGEHLVADVRAQVLLSLVTDFAHFSTCTPAPRKERDVHTMLDQVIAWSRALTTVRSQPLAEAVGARS
jgi:NAD(P)H-dependent FMN reductase